MLDAFVAPPGPQTQKVQWDKANWLCWWFKKKMGGVERKKQVDNKKKKGGEGQKHKLEVSKQSVFSKGLATREGHITTTPGEEATLTPTQDGKVD